MARPFFFNVEPRLSAPCIKSMNLIIRHHNDNKVFIIELPPGSRVRRSEAAGESAIFLPTEGGREVPIFEEPPELLVELARAGKYGLRLLAIEGRRES
jgi:hypothetical protein